MPKYLAIYSRHEYKDESGEVKTRWYKVGYLKLTDNGGKFIRMFHQPHTDYFCFESEAEILPDIQAQN